MLARLSLLSRLAMLVALGGVIVGSPIFDRVAAAQDDEWGDDPFAEEEGDDEEEEQPPVTAGGLFTKKTWPLAELDRPLTLIKGMLEIRGGIDIDMSASQAFETWGAKVDGRYGIQDNVELQAGLNTVFVTPEGGSTSFGIYGGFEAAIAYDLVDFRALVELPLDPDAKFDLAFGFPFRYKPKPKVGIVALDKIMTIHTDGAKPDLTVGVGIIYQVVEKFAVLLRGEVVIPEFNTDADSMSIPATAAFQFTPNNKLDLGGEFTFGDVGNSDAPFDQRSLLLYVQVRM